MARSNRVTRSIPVPDTLYSNRLLTRFINGVMRHGKLRVAEKLVYQALQIIKEKSEDPIKIFEAAINTVGPKMEVRPRRVGGASYQVPMEVRGDRRISLAIRWIIAFALRRSNREYHTFADKLAAEILDAAKGTGEAIKKRDTVHRMAEANRAFAHFKW